MATELRLSGTALDLSRASRRIKTMLDQLVNMRPFWADAAAYMVRSTRYRIRQGWTDPSGEPLEALAELTILLKGGYTKPLYHEGNLHDGIFVDEVSDYGFEIGADARNESGENYAPYVQHGTPDPKGSVMTPDGRRVYPKNPIPARPFLGFSDENISRLSKLLKQHIEKQ